MNRHQIDSHRWQKQHKAKQKLYIYRSHAKHFLAKMASLTDIKNIKPILRQREHELRKDKRHEK